MIAEETRIFKVMPFIPFFFFNSDTRIYRTILKLAAGEVISLTTAMQASSVQWGETDKVTYIQLRSRLHVVFSGYK